MSNWVSFSERFPPTSKALDNPEIETTDRVLVTNNINARDRMGRMSHLWLLAPIKSNDGSVVGFDCSDMKIHGLTHWLDMIIPQDPEQSAQSEIRRE